MLRVPQKVIVAVCTIFTVTFGHSVMWLTLGFGWDSRMSDALWVSA